MNNNTSPTPLERFLLLEKYKKQETIKHLLWSGVTILGICLITFMIDINKGGEFYSYHTSGNDFLCYTLYFLCIAPCLLENNITKQNSVFDLLLPVSTFGKFMHIWLKYLLLLPIFSLILMLAIISLLTLIGTDYTIRFAHDIAQLSKAQLFTLILLHGCFFIGYFGFKRQSLLKSFCLFVACTLFTYILAFASTSILPDDRQGYAIISHMISYPIYNFPLSPTATSALIVCNYAAPVLFMIGIWISGYLLLKEKQL